MNFREVKPQIFWVNIWGDAWLSVSKNLLTYYSVTQTVAKICNPALLSTAKSLDNITNSFSNSLMGTIKNPRVRVAL
jgi:hypothetical protein